MILKVKRKSTVVIGAETGLRLVFDKNELKRIDTSTQSGTQRGFSAVVGDDHAARLRCRHARQLAQQSQHLGIVPVTDDREGELNCRLPAR